MITPQNIFRHEFIGLTIKIEDSNHKDLIGYEGHIIDETRNTITIETGNKKEVQLIKDQIKFKAYLPDNHIVLIDGKYIVGRPQDRIKKKFKKIR